MVRSRKQSDRIVIDESTEVTVLAVRGGRVRLGLTAPAEVQIYGHGVHAFDLASFDVLTRRRRPVAIPDIACPLTGVVLDGGQLFAILAALTHLFEQLSQKRPAPATAGSRAVAVTQLSGALGVFDANEIHDLAFGDVKAQTKFVVEVHGLIVPWRWPGKGQFGRHYEMQTGPRLRWSYAD